MEECLDIPPFIPERRASLSRVGGGGAKGNPKKGLQISRCCGAISNRFTREERGWRNDGWVGERDEQEFYLMCVLFFWRGRARALRHEVMLTEPDRLLRCE